MANDITLSAAVRTNLLALNRTQDLINRTQERLATGLKVASPIDDATAFFEAKALNDRALDLGERKSGIDQGISSITTALNAIESIDTLVRQMKGLAISAKTASGNQLTAIKTQFDELLGQITNLANDASYQGTNLVNSTASQLEIAFSTDTISKLVVPGFDLTTAGLNVTTAGSFSLSTVLDARLTEIDAALSTLRGRAQTIGSLDVELHESCC